MLEKIKNPFAQRSNFFIRSRLLLNICLNN